MDARRYERLSELFASAAELDASARAAMLEQLARDEPELAAELRALLGVDGDEQRLGAFADAQVDTRRERLERALAEPLDPHPKRIASYAIVRLAGRGGMGLVYEARQETPSRRVALKLLDPWSSSPERVRRFRMEAEVLGRLHHAGIAQIFEFDTFDAGRGPQPFFAMEYVEGVDVCSFAEREQLDARARLLLVVKLAEAVQHAHEHGVVHRDLKPDNVLVGADGQPKVLDFGIARADTTSTALSTLHTQEGQMLGTLAYMAPEQLAGRPEQIGPWTDVYALGVIAFQLLARRLPLDPSGLTPVAAVNALGARDAPWLGKVDAQFAGDVETIVAKALEKEPARRYASAAALAADLRRHLDSFPIAARPPSGWYRATKFARRNRALVVGAGAVAFVLLVGVIASTWFAVGESRARALATAREHNALHQAYVAAMLAASEALAAGSPDTARAYVASAPSSLDGWERRHFAARTARNATELEIGGDPLLQLLFVPARRWLLGIGSDGTVRGCDASTGASTLELRVPGAPSIAFVHGDGPRLSVCFVSGAGVGANGRDEYAEWSLDDASLVARWFLGEPGDQWFRTVASRDGSKLGAFTRKGDLVVWDLASRVAQREGGHAQANALAFTRDGRTLAYFDRGRVRIVDTASLEPRCEIAFEGSELVDLVFDPDGRTLAVAQANGGVTLFDVGTDRARIVRHLQENGRVRVMRYADDGSAIGVLSGTGRLHVWTPRGEDLGSIYAPNLRWMAWCFVDGGARIACAGSDQRVRVLDAAQSGVVTLRGHTSYVYPIAFSPDGSTLLSGGWDGADALRTWDARTGEPIGATGMASSIVSCIGFGGDAERALVGISCCGPVVGAPARRGIASFDLRDGSLAGPAFERLDIGGLGTNVEFTAEPRGHRVATLRSDGSLIVLDARDGTLLHEFPIQEPLRGNLPRWSPDAARIALAEVVPEPDMSWSRQSRVRVFDAASYAELGRWKAHDALVLGLDLRPDGAQIATASQDQSVRVWSCPSGAQVAELIGHDQDVLCVRWSPDGSRIATGGRDNRVRLWDASTFEQVAVLAGHTDYVYSLAWSPDGTQLASGSGDGTVRVWETRTSGEREAALRERRELVERWQPQIDARLATGEEPNALAASLRARADLESREREVALQVLLQRELSRSPTGTR